MKVVTIAARKGGAGKTLLTASFAVLACQDCTERKPEGDDARTASVAMIDLDPQGCLTDWRNGRSLPGPALIAVAPRYLPKRLAELEARGVEYVFIDTPPGQTEYRALGMAFAHLVVIPTRPAELDLSATIKTAVLAERSGARYAVLPNAANFRSRAMGETIRMLRDAGLSPLPPIHNRVGLALSSGRTLSENDPTSRGAAELAATWAAIIHLLKGGSRG